MKTAYATIKVSKSYLSTSRARCLRRIHKSTLAVPGYH